MRSRFAVLGLLCLLALSSACDEASPVAPVGSILAITANPAQIDPNGTSNIVVIARKEDGSPVNPGTEILFATTLGTIDGSARTDELGVARATLRGDGRVGTATVTALSGAATAVTVDVQIGSFASSITLVAQPPSVTDAGGTISLTSTVRDENGQLLPDAALNFLTEIGLLESGGAPVFTDETGTARDTLTVSAQDLEGVTETLFTVRAQTAGAGGLIIEASFDVGIQVLAPIASFDAVDAGDCAIAFVSTSTGAEPLSFEWSFGDGETSSEENPTHDYSDSIVDTDGDGETCPDDDADGLEDATVTFAVELIVTNEFGDDSTVETVTVDPN